VLDRLAEEADLVVVDTPAMLPVGDTSAIAPKVDGLIFLVDMHVVKRPQLASAADQLARLPIRILGTVIRVAHEGGHYYRSRYGGYGYSSSYSQNGNDGKQPAAKKDKVAAAQSPAPAAVPDAATLAPAATTPAKAADPPLDIGAGDAMSGLGEAADPVVPTLLVATVPPPEYVPPAPPLTPPEAPSL
jgi:hypothetical protein